MSGSVDGIVRKGDIGCVVRMTGNGDDINEQGCSQNKDKQGDTARQKNRFAAIFDRVLRSGSALRNLLEHG